MYYYIFIFTEKNNCSLISINEHQDLADTEIDEECFHDVLEVNNLVSIA